MWDSLVFRVGPQAGPGRDGRERKHEGGHTLWTGALRRPGTVQVAVRRVVQRRDARQPDGERRHTRVRRPARMVVIHKTGTDYLNTACAIRVQR